MSQIMLYLFGKSLSLHIYIDFDDSISCLASCKDVILVLALIDWEYLLMIYGAFSLFIDQVGAYYGFWRIYWVNKSYPSFLSMHLLSVSSFDSTSLFLFSQKINSTFARYDLPRSQRGRVE